MKRFRAVVGLKNLVKRGAGTPKSLWKQSWSSFERWSTKRATSEMYPYHDKDSQKTWNKVLYSQNSCPKLQSHPWGTQRWTCECHMWGIRSQDQVSKALRLPPYLRESWCTSGKRRRRRWRQPERSWRFKGKSYLDYFTIYLTKNMISYPRFKDNKWTYLLLLAYLLSPFWAYNHSKDE